MGRINKTNDGPANNEVDTTGPLKSTKQQWHGRIINYFFGSVALGNGFFSF